MNDSLMDARMVVILTDIITKVATTEINATEEAKGKVNTKTDEEATIRTEKAETPGIVTAEMVTTTATVAEAISISHAKKSLTNQLSTRTRITGNSTVMTIDSSPKSLERKKAHSNSKFTSSRAPKSLKLMKLKQAKTASKTLHSRWM